MHGPDIRAGRDSGNCAYKKDVGKSGGHNFNATRANPVVLDK